MLKLSFKQTKAEFMVRVASTLLFNQLVKANANTVSVREITESVQYGYTDKASQSEVGPKFVRITDLKDGQVNWETVPYCVCNNPEQYLLKQGDLIFARTGATTGKTHLFRETPPIAVFASYLIRVRPTQVINPEYLYFFFQSDLYWSQISSHKEGSAQPNVNGQKLSNIELPIVDEETQIAVCKFLAAVRTRQDGVIQELPELPFPLDEQRGVLERVEVIIARITKAQSLRDVAIEQTNKLFEHAARKIFTGQEPKVPLGNVLTLQRGYDLPRQDRVEGPFPIYAANGEVARHNEFRAKGPGVITGRSGSVGSAKYVEEDYWPLNTALYVKDFKGNEPKLVYYLIQSISKELKDASSHTAVPTLDRKKAHTKIFVHIPPLDEQRRIVAYLDSVQARLASLRELQSQTGEELSALLPSVLDRVFKGEL